MNALAHAAQTNVVAANEPATIMEIIGRAAADPNTDIEKLERLLGLYERVSAVQAERAFSEAMNAAQAELARVAADAHNPQTKSRYASYPALDRAIRPIYARHGFSLSFDTGEGAPADMVRVVCYVAHTEGHKRAYHVDMPADGKGAKGGDVMTKTHATGAAMSYGQRYLLKLIFNIAVGEDTDGNDPFPGDKISQAQVDDLIALMDEVGADRTRFLNYLRVQGLSDLPAKRLKDAVAALEAKRGK